MQSFRSALTAVLMVVLSSVVAALGLEVAVRVLNDVPVFASTNFVVQALDLIRANTGSMVHDEMLGWKLRDDIYQPNGGFTTGPYGLRMNQNALRAPQTGGVLTVGDSFTAGSGVRDNETWPAQLEGLIGRQVHNAGVGAYGVDQMILRAESLIPVLKPRDLIVGILSQDILRNNFDIYGGGYKPWFKVENGKAVLQGVPVPRVDAKPIGLNVWRSVFGHSFLVHWSMIRLGLLQWWVDNKNRYRQVHPAEGGVAVSCALMDRLVQLQQDQALRVIIVVFWGASEVMQSPPAWFVSPAIECARARGLATLDLYNPLREIGVSDQTKFEPLWIDEGGVLGHPSAQGHAITARMLQEQFFSSAEKPR